MPALRNQKHENFSQLTLQGAKYGWTQAEIYKRAGYHATGHSAEMAASRLMKKDEIQRRIAELGEPAVKKTRATVDTLAAQFDAVFDGAMGSAQFGAAGSAAAAKGKLLGFMREKLEVGGPGSFDGLQTTEEVIAQLLSDQSASEALESLAILRDAIEHHAADHADVVAAIDPARPRPNEGDLSLAPYRKRRGR
jgi:hypothetical protein